MEITILELILVIVTMVVCYGIAFSMLFRVFLVAYTFNTDCPFVPSTGRIIKKCLSLLEIKDGDKVVDIGSGDGKFVIMGARRYPKAKFYGVEPNKFLVRISRIRAKLLGLKNVEFFAEKSDTHDFSKYNKVFMYLTSVFAGEVMEDIENDLPNDAIVVNADFGFAKKFESNHKVEKIPFTIRGKRTKISLWHK